jgi:hypothetical protein
MNIRTASRHLALLQRPTPTLSYFTKRFVNTMSAATTSTTFKYDTEVHIPGTALLNLAGDILDKYQKSRLQQFKEADRTDDEDARVDAGEFLVDCQQAQWLIDRERYRANLADSKSATLNCM